ncbi:hypothetical protein NESM_000853500 [Novymonas esmeraldas]|uniref:Membrane-associated protein n=1 Tax=Novymonas esmeraldas TaxID=1808958 RepID=A0AAW0EYD9_9TRYP
MRSVSASIAAAALLVGLLLCSVADVAHAQGLPGLLLLQIKGYMTYSSASLASSHTPATYVDTETTCFNAGGVPASPAYVSVINEIAANMRNNGADSYSTIYAGSSAAPSLSPTTCAERTPALLSGKSSASCSYRWRYGFYDLYTFDGEPGTAYWLNLYKQSSGPTQVQNNYQQVVWNPGKDSAGNFYPRGYYGGIASPSPTGGLYSMDESLTANDNDPNPLNKYMIVCEYQYYPIRPPVSTRMPQPSFVNGFKDLTWPQQHWWVIFLIVAVIILAGLIAIIIYCCATSTKPKEEEPIFQMVIRERVGKAYIVGDESATMEKQQRGGAMPHPLMPNPQNMTPEEAEEHRRQMRYGRGFNPQQQMNPEDMAMGVAGIYNNGERRQYADGNACVDAEGNPIESNFADIGEDALPRMVPVYDGQDEDAGGDTASQAPSAITSKRRSARRNRSRTTSQTFDDVELPQAGEIDETNVNL